MYASLIQNPFFTSGPNPRSPSLSVLLVSARSPFSLSGIQLAWIAVTKYNAPDLLAGYKCSPNGETIITLGAGYALANVLLHENGGGWRQEWEGVGGEELSVH